ncbi:DUF1365 domain-containing protein [Novispirillum sp. DQ9]|uniref:DUF1365 domain-containing protein n=1 Tax=Novispirillum sp. DQ9 TaxID=3398612 RepID=UPI003C7E8799
MTPAAALYHGTVLHRRLRPRRHVLRYRVFWMMLDLDRLGEVAARSRLFAWNRPGVLSFHDADHGDGSGRALRPQIEALTAGAGIADADGPIRVLCYPRLLGFVFNPLTVYLCHRRDDSLAAIVYEVSNTFGERHSYVLPVAAAASGEAVRQSADKRFFVSPFIGMDVRYHFRVVPPGERVAVAITETDAEGAFLHASFSGRFEALSDRALIRALLRYPLMTVKVIAGIHWEALRLWRKGVPLHRRPAVSMSPSSPVSTTDREIP